MTRKRLFLPLLLACGGLLAFVVVGCGESGGAADPVCGNAVLEGDEACDNGTLPGTLAGGACTDTCTWREFDPDTGASGGSGREAAVAMNARGDFVIVWQGRDGTLGGERLDVFAAVYGANGALRAPVFRVNQETAMDQMYPSVGIDGEGRFVVVWFTSDEAGMAVNPSLDNVSMRAFLADGTPATDEVQVNTWTDGPHGRAYVAVNNGGDMVISWSSDGQDGDLMGVYAQRGDSGGNLLATPPFQVHTVTIDDQENPHVGISESGEFVIAYESFGQEES
ncbi:MAG: hypothetical protein ABI333_15605 [bacterium]